jgi:acetolactate synthase-1/2/3 large subunit
MVPPEMKWEQALYGQRIERGSESMASMDGGALVGRILKEQNVKYLFAINGGHTFPILANLRSNDIKLIHMRHEQACAYAADAYARTTATPGVCSVTAGCGLTNAVTGLCVAGLTGSAVVCIAGQHPTTEDYLGSFQEAYGSDICSSFSKFAKRVIDWSTIEVDLRHAFREAMSPPQGPALVEIPTNLLYHGDAVSGQRKGAKVYPPDQLRAQGDPHQVERALELLLAAERPLIVGGDGIFWSGAAAELRELAELTHIPAYTRRAGQGAIPEDHPLAIAGAWKKPFTGRADVVLAVGFKFWSGEHFGEAPTWNDRATYIQVDPVPSRIGWHVPAEVAIVGDPKLVLHQLIDTAKRLNLDFARHRQSSWVQEVAQVRANYLRTIDERERTTRDSVPTHPDHLARTLCEVIDRDATLIVDSFTLSGWMTQWFTARFAGQVVDAGPLAPVGHGVGMGIGAQLARPGKQVVLITGDGGLGIGGWDIETALRYELPIITVLWNNSSWGPSFDQMPLLKGRTDPFSMLENIRYDQMFQVLGCHTEQVEVPAQLRPALERSCHAGKASLINVVGDKRIGHPRLGGNLLGSTQM